MFKKKEKQRVQESATRSLNADSRHDKKISNEASKEERAKEHGNEDDEQSASLVPKAEQETEPIESQLETNPQEVLESESEPDNTNNKEGLGEAKSEETETSEESEDTESDEEPEEENPIEEAYCIGAGIGNETRMRAKALLKDIADSVSSGRFNPEVFKIAIRILDYDSTIEKVRKEAYEEGNSDRIAEAFRNKRKMAEQAAQIPHFNGLKLTNPFKGESIFDLAREAKK